jgi:cysteine desulfurase
MAVENERIRMLRDRLLKGLMDIEEVYVNGDLEQRVPHNLNVSFNFVEGESLIMAIKDIAVSSGSACTSASLEPSYVLRALGRSDELAHSSIRFTIGRFTTQEEIDFTIKLLHDKLGKLRDLSPLWEMYKDGVDLTLRAVGCALPRKPIMAYSEKVSTTTKTRATSVPSPRTTRASAPAWSARRPAAT